MDIEGLVYLLNQAGAALAQSNAKIGQLSHENEQLRAQISALSPKSSSQNPTAPTFPPSTSSEVG